MRLQEMRAIVCAIEFRNYHFDVIEIVCGGPRILRARFMAKDIVTGEPEEQFTRKWLLSEHMTRSEIVATALKCVLTSEEHEAREDFLYRGQRIFGPHLDVEELVEFTKGAHTDVRHSS
ncbi:MAG: hypothetical protein HOP33_19175 [Verrucomicrobia bacterium]|nr:hypothetical protein [Verrucomicrobiota bacterium]